jgi:UDP-2,4-diacetamido-2,4,6-trideoxy-beta-L-altropyranose hydrolase
VNDRPSGGAPLLIRADATRTSGSGHVMRSIALAQAWQDAGGEATLGMARGAETFAGRLAREGIAAAAIAGEPGSAADAGETCRIAEDLGARSVVVDGYWAQAPYQSAVRREGFRLAVLDDTGELSPYDADVIVNQNLHASEAMYRERRPETVLLLGTRYALLRRELRRAAPAQRPTPGTARRLLVTLGGSDPDGVTARVLRALRPLAAETELAVVVGPANPGVDEIAAAARAWGDRGRVVANVEDFTSLLEWADLAVSGGGSTCWELCFFGVPFVTVVLAPNQESIAESLERAGASRNAGRAADLSDAGLAAAVGALAGSSQERRRMRESGRALVDGRGAVRVAERLRAAEAA